MCASCAQMPVCLARATNSKGVAVFAQKDKCNTIIMHSPTYLGLAIGLTLVL